MSNTITITAPDATTTEEDIVLAKFVAAAEALADAENAAKDASIQSESSYVAFAAAAAAARTNFTTAALVKALKEAATQGGVKIPVASDGALNYAEVIASIIALGDAPVGWVFRIPSSVIPLQDVELPQSDGTVKVIKEQSIGSLVKAVIQPSDVALLKEAGVKSGKSGYGKARAVAAVKDATTVEEAIDALKAAKAELDAKIKEVKDAKKAAPTAHSILAKIAKLAESLEEAVEAGEIGADDAQIVAAKATLEVLATTFADLSEDSAFDVAPAA